VTTSDYACGGIPYEAAAVAQQTTAHHFTAEQLPEVFCCDWRLINKHHEEHPADRHLVDLCI
jgi:elongation factor P--beta-lysine ligase